MDPQFTKTQYFLACLSKVEFEIILRFNRILLKMNQVFEIVKIKQQNLIEKNNAKCKFSIYIKHKKFVLFYSIVLHLLISIIV